MAWQHGSLLAVIESRTWVFRWHWPLVLDSRRDTGRPITLTHSVIDLSASSLAYASLRPFFLCFGRRVLTRSPASELPLASARSLVFYTWAVRRITLRARFRHRNSASWK